MTKGAPEKSPNDAWMGIRPLSEAEMVQVFADPAVTPSWMRTLLPVSVLVT